MSSKPAPLRCRRIGRLGGEENVPAPRSAPSQLKRLLFLFGLREMDGRIQGEDVLIWTVHPAQLFMGS